MQNENDSMKRVEKLEQELSMFKAIAESSSDAIQVVRPEDGVMMYTNPAHGTIYGCGDGHVGKQVSVLLADPSQLPGIFEALTKDGRFQGKTTFRRQDGSTFSAAISVKAVAAPGGKPHSLVGFIRPEA